MTKAKQQGLEKYKGAVHYDRLLQLPGGRLGLRTLDQGIKRSVKTMYNIAGLLG